MARWGCVVDEGTGVKRRHVVAVLALTAPLVLAACSGAAGTSTATSTTTTPGTASGIVYRFGVVGNHGKIASLELHRPTPVTGISGTVVQIATSNSDGYALTSNGEVWAWGVASAGELGDGRTSPYDTHAVKVDFPAGVKIATLANPMPFDGALAIDAHGRAWGWGLNAVGDLCLTGGTELRPEPLPLSDVTLATGARTHSLFDAHGRVYACGSGDYGELGTGSTADSATPTAVVGLPDTGVTTLTSSWGASGALLDNGAYYNWGYNAAGQLGNASTADSAVPVHVELPATVRQVFQGGSGAKNGQTVVILANGSAWAWGANTRGQLGNGATTSSDVPVAVDVPAGVTFVTVNSGGYTSYAIDRSGSLWAWGDNLNGQLGTGPGTRRATRPVEVGIHLSQVSSTANNVAGLDRS